MEELAKVIKGCCEELIKEYKEGKTLSEEHYKCIIDYLLIMRGE